MNTETMKPVEVIVPCPSCARPMSSVGNSWQCLACNPTPTNIPTCKTQKCLRPLTRLGDPWNCWICLHCNDHPDVVNKRKKETEYPEKKYIDKTLTPETVKDMIKKEMAGVGDMIREAMSEFSLKEPEDPDYPPTRATITQIAESVYNIDEDEESVEDVNKRVQENLQSKPHKMPWLKKAKELGVETNLPGGGGMRKKAEILADIEKAEGASDGGSSDIKS